MRSGAPPTFEQLQCILRPVGTIVANGAVPTGVSPAAVNVLELRQDMVTGAQGAGGVNASDFTTGYNIPSLLGVQVGAPYFHAGNARTLEEALSSTFQGHYQSPVAQVFSPDRRRRSSSSSPTCSPSTAAPRPRRPGARRERRRPLPLPLISPTRPRGGARLPAHPTNRNGSLRSLVRPASR